MKECFYRYAPFVLLVGGAGIWLTAFIVDDKISLKIVLIFCILVQLFLLLYCGIIIQKLYRQANIDSLTGICNRRYFFTKISKILKMKLPVSLMMIDVDNFKNINDKYGHESGDEVLRQLAMLINNNTRSTDIVARLSGDEFVVVLPLTNYEIVLKVAQRIKQAVESTPLNVNSYTVKTTISIGIVTTTQQIPTDCFLKHADESLYKAKEIKNSIVVYK